MSMINNIGYLKQDLRNNDWHMTAFLFQYKNTEYDVLFEDIDNLSKKNPYASVKLTFIDIDHPDRTYAVETNQVKIFFDVKEFRNFFRIEYSTNLGNIFDQFFQSFLKFVPATAPLKLNDRQNNEIDRCLAENGNHNPNAIYCYDARRLGKRDGSQLHRSIFISNLTKRRKPDLYKYFKNEPTVTFFYSPNAEDELPTTEIINKFTKRESEKK